MDFGEAAGTDFSTMRGRDYPAIRQFTVFLENRVGQLLDILRRFEGTAIRVVAISIADSAECAVVRLVLNQVEPAREILERAGLAIIERDLVAVELPDADQPLLSVCTALVQAEINIMQAFPLLTLANGRAVIALMVDDIETAQETLVRKGLKLLSENDLLMEG